MLIGATMPKSYGAAGEDVNGRLVLPWKRKERALRQPRECHALRQRQVYAAFLAHGAAVLTGVFF